MANIIASFLKALEATTIEARLVALEQSREQRERHVNYPALEAAE